jgi:hypothetical protein
LSGPKGDAEVDIFTLTIIIGLGGYLHIVTQGAVILFALSFAAIYIPLSLITANIIWKRYSPSAKVKNRSLNIKPL